MLMANPISLSNPPGVQDLHLKLLVATVAQEEERVDW
jgi:hypothetical protein